MRKTAVKTVAARRIAALVGLSAAGLIGFSALTAGHDATAVRAGNTWGNGPVPTAVAAGNTWGN
ncbi:hypothetical protein AB0K09_14680 [Streptomyces sp. NPDC049577]|uniref:hypothetical protein n=1 Tax=Streptomyces sp. NPDC049577 TaxID=3155153 RepID=UPI00343BCE31